MNFTINKGIRKCTEFYKSTQDESKVNYSDLNALFSTADIPHPEIYIFFKKYYNKLRFISVYMFI